MPNHRDMANQPVMKRDRSANGMNPPRTGQGDLSHLTAPIQHDPRAMASQQVTNESHLEGVMNPLIARVIQNHPIAIGLKKEPKVAIDHLEEIAQDLLATAEDPMPGAKDQIIFRKAHIQKEKRGTNHSVNAEKVLIPTSQNAFRKIQLAGLSKKNLVHLVRIRGLENFQNHPIAIGLRKKKTSHLVKVVSNPIQNLKSAKAQRRNLARGAVVLLKRETHHRKSFRGTWW